MACDHAAAHPMPWQDKWERARATHLGHCSAPFLWSFQVSPLSLLTNPKHEQGWVLARVTSGILQLYPHFLMPSRQQGLAVMRSETCICAYAKCEGRNSRA